MQHPTVKLHKSPARQRRGKAVWLGFAGILLARLFSPRRLRPGCDDLKRHDYPVSTQRMGVRFTERIRDTFRFRWVRKA